MVSIILDHEKGIGESSDSQIAYNDEILFILE